MPPKRIISVNFSMGKSAVRIEEAAFMLSMGRNAVRALIASGQLKSFQNGTSVLIPVESIKRYIFKASGLDQELQD